jgi:hypothetical protein
MRSEALMKRVPPVLIKKIFQCNFLNQISQTNILSGTGFGFTECGSETLMERVPYWSVYLFNSPRLRDWVDPHLLARISLETVELR